jgi:hypothetical protein
VLQVVVDVKVLSLVVVWVAFFLQVGDP